MNKCLVTTLKAHTNNEALSKYNVLTIKTKAVESPTLDTQLFGIGASENNRVSINSPSVGLYKSGISGELLSYPIPVTANGYVNSHFENKDGIIEVTGKYNLNTIILGSNATVRMKEIYGIPGTIVRLDIRSFEEVEIDATKFKNALNIRGPIDIELPLESNVINKLNKNTLYEFTSIEKFNDGIYILFEDGLGLDDLANITSLKRIACYSMKEGNLSSLAKLTNLESIDFSDGHQNSGDIMDFINPWIQSGRTSGKIRTQWIGGQRNITLNGSPISSLSTIVEGTNYLNWTSDGTVTFTAS